MIFKIVIFLNICIYSLLTLRAQDISYNQEFRINTFTSSNQWHPSISYLTNGNFVVCWEGYAKDNIGFRIYGQLFNSDGSKLGDKFEINSPTKYSQDTKRLILLK
jgi:hypothetical protein